MNKDDKANGTRWWDISPATSLALTCLILIITIVGLAGKAEKERDNTPSEVRWTPLPSPNPGVVCWELAITHPAKAGRYYLQCWPEAESEPG